MARTAGRALHPAVTDVGHGSGCGCATVEDAKTGVQSAQRHKLQGRCRAWRALRRAVAGGGRGCGATDDAETGVQPRGGTSYRVCAGAARSMTSVCTCAWLEAATTVGRSSERFDPRVERLCPYWTLRRIRAFQLTHWCQKTGPVHRDKGLNRTMWILRYTLESSDYIKECKRVILY